MIKEFPRALAIFISRLCAAVLILAPFAASAQAQENKPEVFFYIVSVPPPPGFSQLPSLEERAKELRDFIKETYQADEKHLRLLELVEETKTSRIKALLYDELPNLPTDSMIFFFLLTHAELQRFPNSKTADLRIITSDTDKDDLSGTSIHGLELLSAFSHAPSRSLVFAFLDSCDSGGLGTPLNKLLGTISNSLESRMFVMTSSAAGQPSYAGNFTQALVEVWRSQGLGCLKNDYFVDALDKKLEAANQKTQVIVSFSGPCLNFANQSIGLLVVWNETDDLISLEFPDNLGSATVLAGGDPTLVPIPRSVKNVNVFRSNKALGVLSLDLSTNPVSLYKIPQGPQGFIVEKEVDKYLQTAERVAQFGFEREAQAYKLFAAGFARRSGDEAQAQAIEATIDRVVAPQEVLAALDYYKDMTSLQGTNPEIVGNYLAGLGQFHAAYSVYLKAFESGQDDPDVFGGLYTSLVLAGKEEAAKEIRIDHPDLFEQSEEARLTKVLLNTADAGSDVTAVHGMESAATRVGLVLNEPKPIPVKD